MCVDTYPRFPPLRHGSCATSLAVCRYALGPWDMFKACAHREWILMRRHSFHLPLQALPCPLPTLPTRPTAEHALADTCGLC